MLKLQADGLVLLRSGLSVGCKAPRPRDDQNIEIALQVRRKGGEWSGHHDDANCRIVENLVSGRPVNFYTLDTAIAPYSGGQDKFSGEFAFGLLRVIDRTHSFDFLLPFFHVPGNSMLVTCRSCVSYSHGWLHVLQVQRRPLRTFNRFLGGWTVNRCRCAARGEYRQEDRGRSEASGLRCHAENRGRFPISHIYLSSFFAGSGVCLESPHLSMCDMGIQ